MPTRPVPFNWLSSPASPSARAKDETAAPATIPTPTTIHPKAFIPIPGFKTTTQVEENAGALAYGPLSSDQLAEVATILTR